MMMLDYKLQRRRYRGALAPCPELFHQCPPWAQDQDKLLEKNFRRIKNLGGLQPPHPPISYTYDELAA